MKQTAEVTQCLPAGLLRGIQAFTHLDKDKVSECGALGFMSKIWANIDS